MDLVDDVDLESRRDRPVADPLDDLAGVVNTGMACRVDLQNIHMAAAGDGLAGFAHAAWLKRRAALSVLAYAVEPARQKPRRRGLADPANTGQHEGMRQPAKRQRVAKGAHKRLLADQFGKSLRPVLACQHAIAVENALAHPV